MKILLENIKKTFDCHKMSADVAANLDVTDLAHFWKTIIKDTIKLTRSCEFLSQA